MRPEVWQQVRHLLVVQPGGPEAVEATIGVLRQLQISLPLAEQVLLVSPAVQARVAHLPGVKAVLVLPEALGGMTDLIQQLRQQPLDAAVILTAIDESPYPLAYVCYLAGIPLRLGQSQEFGGGLLSDWVKPQGQPSSLAAHYQFLLEQGSIAPSDDCNAIGQGVVGAGVVNVGDRHA